MTDKNWAGGRIIVPLNFPGGKCFDIAGNKKIGFGFLGAFQEFVVFRISLWQPGGEPWVKPTGLVI